MKIVINTDFGGFGLSHEAMMGYSNLAHLNLKWKESKFGPTLYYIDGEIDNDDFYFDEYRIKRNDPDLVSVVEKLGSAANGRYANLKVVTIPDGVEWEICEYDGREWVAEKHRTWS